MGRRGPLRDEGDAGERPAVAVRLEVRPGPLRPARGYRPRGAHRRGHRPDPPDGVEARRGLAPCRAVLQRGPRRPAPPPRGPHRRHGRPGERRRRRGQAAVVARDDPPARGLPQLPRRGRRPLPAAHARRVPRQHGEGEPPQSPIRPRPLRGLRLPPHGRRHRGGGPLVASPGARRARRGLQRDSVRDAPGGLPEREPRVGSRPPERQPREVPRRGAGRRASATGPSGTGRASAASCSSK